MNLCLYLKHVFSEYLLTSQNSFGIWHNLTWLIVIVQRDDRNRAELCCVVWESAQWLLNSCCCCQAYTFKNMQEANNNKKSLCICGRERRIINKHVSKPVVQNDHLSHTIHHWCLNWCLLLKIWMSHKIINAENSLAKLSNNMRIKAMLRNSIKWIILWAPEQMKPDVFFYEFLSTVLTG